MPIVNVVLFVGACIGHTALLVVSLNCIYGLPLPRWVLRPLRIFHGLLVLAGPLAFWYAFGLNRPDAIPEYATDEARRSILAAYGRACCVVAFGLVPAVTLWRLLRPRPAVLLGNHTQTVNVAALLGYKPVGRGKHRHIARLPGNQVFQVDFSDRTLRLPRLPAAWNGLTILHLSDLHLCGTPDRVFFTRVMDLCREWEPDLVALTGDFVDTERHHRWIVPVLGRLRWRIAAFAVLGNHDLWQEPDTIRKRVRRAGLRVLGNGWEQIDVRGEPLLVVGNEAPWFRPAPDLSECPPAAFRLCVTHTPDNIAWARRNGIDLLLAGHNHGGQIRFPLIGSVLVPSLYSRRYDCGTFHEPPTVLHVSRGLSGQQPLRYNCRPEVTRLILRCATADA